MPLTYRQVKDLHDSLYDAGVVTKPLPEWSDEMNRLTESDLYGAGLHDNLLKRASVGVDRALEAIPGLVPATTELGRSVGELVGAPEAGANIGAGLPRTTLNFLPLLIPGVGIGATAARLGGTALLSGAGTYTETGSPAAGLLSGATAAALPKVADVAEQLTLRSLGGKLVQGPLADEAGNVFSQVRRFFPETVSQKAASFGAGQTAAAGLMAGATAGEEVLSDQPLSNPLSTEALLGLALGQLPFAGIHAISKATGIGKVEGRQADRLQAAVDSSRKRVEFKQAKDRLEERTPIEKIPNLEIETEPIRPEVIQETQLRLAQLRGEQIKAADDPNLSPEQKFEVINRSMAQEAELARTREVPVPDSVMGDVITKASPRLEVTGHEVKRTDKWRAVFVPDVEGNPPELRGKIVTYSTAYEPTTEKGKFSLPDPQWRTVKTVEEWQARYKKAEGPELPVQERQFTEPELDEYLHELDKIHDKVETAETPAELQSAIVQLGSVQQENALPATNDATLVRTAKRLADDPNIPADKITQASVKAEIAKTTRRLRKLQERTLQVQTAEEFRTQQAELGKTSEEVSGELTRLSALEKQIEAKGGQWATKLTGGEISRFYHRWVQTGRIGGFDRLADEVKTAARTGAGLIRDTPVVDQLAKATKKLELSAQPIRNLVDESALTVLNSSESREVYNKWDRKTESTFQQEANMFSTLVLEFGSLKDVDVNDAAEFLHERDGIPVPEAKDEVKDFLGRPHVQAWEQMLDTQLQKLRDVNSSPRPNDQSWNTPILFVENATTNAKLFLDRPEPKVETAVQMQQELLTKDLPEPINDLVKAADFSTLNGINDFQQKFRDLIRFTESAPDGQKSEPFIPESSEVQRVLDSMVGKEKNGHGLVNYMLGEEGTLQLAKYLQQFPDLLNNVEVEMGKTATGGSIAQQLANRKVLITLSHGLINSSSEARARTMAHELLHGLTIVELDNPSKAGLAKEFTELRERLVNNLSKELKADYDKAIASDWYHKYVNGEVEFQSLSGTQENRSLIYGLLSDKEMVAQAYTSEALQNYMRSVKQTGKETGWSKFVNVVKRLLGIGDKIDDNAFGEFLGKTHALLTHGEHVSSFTDFTQRYFENMGLTKGLADVQTRRGLGLVLESEHGLTPEQIYTHLASTPSRSNEFIQAQRELNKVIQDKGDTFIHLSDVLAEQGFNPNLVGVQDLLQGALRGDLSNFHDIADVLPPEASRFLFTQLRDMQQVLGGVGAATVKENKGLLNLADPKALSGPIGEALGSIRKLLEVEKNHQGAQRIVDGLSAITPDGYLDSIVNDPVGAPEWLEGADKTKKSLGGWVKNFLQPTGQLARSNPETAEVLSKGYQLLANARKMLSEALKVFGMDLDKYAVGEHQLSSESVKRSEQAFQNPRLERAADLWVHQSQVKGKINDAIVMLPDTDPDVQKILSKLNPKERKDVHEIVSKRQISNQIMQGQVLEKMLQVAATDGAVVAGASSGLKVSQNISLSHGLLRAATLDRTNVDEVNRFIEEFGVGPDQVVTSIQQKMTAQGFLDLLRYSQNEAAKWKVWQEHFQRNPDWASGQRYGKFLVDYKTSKGKVIFAGVESRKEAEVTAEHRGWKIANFERNVRDESDAPPVLGPDSLKLIDTLRKLDDSQEDILKRSGFTDEDIAKVRASSSTEQLVKEEVYRGGVPNLRPQPRGLTKGAEELPWMSNHFSWASKTSNFWSRQLLRAQARAHLLEPEIAQNKDLQQKLKTHFDNILHPDTETGRNLQRFVSTWFMGYNPASAVVNATQPFTTHVAELTSLTGRPVDSYRRVINALSEVAGKGIGRKDWKGPDHEWLIHEASKDGELDFSMFDDQAQAQESIETNYKRAMERNRVQSLGQRLKTAAGAYTTAGMWMFKGVERVNNQAALLASFDYYREQGLSRDDAKEKAYEFNHAVNFGGGRAQRPIGAFSGRGAFPRTVAMTATALQNYVLGTTFQLVRYIQRGFFRPQGITPAEVHAARRAAVQMLGTQLVAAGTLGLPFVSGAIALLDKAFPDLEVGRRLRETVAELFSSDKENGSILADAAMTGLPSMFGWDLQSRLSMGNTVPGVSEINGFQPELLLGPPANLVSTFVSGATQLAQGNLRGAQSFVPSALKKAVGYATSGGQVKDYKDRPLFTPTKGETLGLFLGFQPKRLSDLNAANRIAEQNRQVSVRQAAQENQQLAEEILKGNFGSVRQVLQQKSVADPNFDVRAAVNTISRSAEELTFPRDLRREGTKNTSAARSRLLSAFDISPSQPTEAARLQFRQQVQQRLGLMTSNRAESALATVMDQLRLQNPEATRSELRVQAERMLRRPRSHELLTQESL